MEKKCHQIGIIDKTGYEKANRVYSGGVSPTIQSRDYKDAVKVVKKWKKRKP